MATAVYPAAAELPNVGDWFNHATDLTATYIIAASTVVVMPSIIGG